MVRLRLKGSGGLVLVKGLGFRVPFHGGVMLLSGIVKLLCLVFVLRLQDLQLVGSWVLLAELLRFVGSKVFRSLFLEEPLL